MDKTERSCVIIILKQFFRTKNKFQTLTIGANTQIVSQLHSLKIEKDILTKTIARLYENESDLTKIQRDRLLLRYQHQLGIIITKIEKLDNASKHPDLGPLGDGLITLMDQKLSQLDQRLYELTSKIEVAQSEKVIKKRETKKIESSKPVFEKPLEEFVDKDSKKIEITTLTQIPKLDPVKQSKYDQMLSQLNTDVITPPPLKPKIQETPKIKTPIVEEQNIPQKVDERPPAVEVINPIQKEIPKPIVELPEEEDLDEDDDDLAAIKARIMKTMSKIEQAEVD